MTELERLKLEYSMFVSKVEKGNERIRKLNHIARESGGGKTYDVLEYVTKQSDSQIHDFEELVRLCKIKRKKEKEEGEDLQEF